MSARSLPLSVHYALLFGFLGVFTPFGPIWLESRGLSPSQIALITSATIWARLFFVPFAGEIADSTGRLRLIIAVLAIGAIAALLPLPFQTSFWPILALGALALGFHSAITPISETLTLSHTRAGQIDYGRVRLWGSLGFCGVAAGMGPVIDTLGPGAIPWAMLALVSVLLLGVVALPPRSTAGGRPALKPTKRVHASGTTRALLTSPFMLVFLFTSGCLLASHATYFGFSTIHWSRTGSDALTSGLLWSEALLAEGVLFFFGAAIVRRFAPLGLLGISALTGVMRWVLMAATSDPLVLMFSQLLQAGTFACAHLGAMYILVRNVKPEMSARAQAIYFMVCPCLFLGGSIVLAGPLYDTFGQKAYLADVIWSAVGGLGVMVLAVMMRRLPTQSRAQSHEPLVRT